MIRRDLFKIAGSCAAAAWTSESLARSALVRSIQNDEIRIIRRALALHPGLYRYRSPSEVERSLAALDSLWRTQTSLEERYLSLSRFLATIRCGHSYCNFFNQSKTVAASLFDRPTRLPIHFVWVGAEMVVTNGFDTGLPAGTLIDAVNGMPPRSWREKLMPFIRADGHNDAKRVSLLEVRGDDRIETFDVFQGLLLAPQDGKFRLNVRLPGGRRDHSIVTAIGLNARRKQMAPSIQSATESTWQWSMRADGIAILTMPGWAMWSSSWDWKSWLNERLDTLSGAKGLIVDIRDNEGGEDCGDLILARMIDRPFMSARIEQRLRFRRTPTDLDPFLDTWDESFRTMGKEAIDLGGGYFRRPETDDSLTIQPRGKRLTCPIRVLTSPVNSSATFQFASNVRSSGAGKLVGRPTGGNRRGINGGSFFFVRLPDSGLEFDLPLVGYFPTTPQPDAGLMPDIFAEPTIQSMVAKTDPAMTAAIGSLQST